MVAIAAFVVLALVPCQERGSGDSKAPAATIDDKPLNLFVALDGDDDWSGLLKESDGKGGGPLRTPQFALRRAREMRAADPSLRERSVVIRLAPETFFLDSPLVIGPADSGSPHHRLSIVGQWKNPVHGDSWKGRGTTLCGGRRITGWRTARLGERDVWVADVPDVDGEPSSFHELFVDGSRATRARHPDRGYLAIAGVDVADAGKPWNQGVKSLRVAPADLAKVAGDESADLTLMSRWVESHCRIRSTDAATGIVKLRDATVFKPDPGDLCYVESLAALDQPGEWWLDEKARLLYYLPTPHDTIDRTEFMAPRLTSLLVIGGGDPADRRVHDVSIHSIRFEGAEWWYPAPADPTAARSSGAVQAAFDVPAAIRLRNATGIVIESCRVTNCGTYGIELGRGCRENWIEGCDLVDLGGGGVKIGEPAIPAAGGETGANRVQDCTIETLGRLFHSAVGVWIGQSPDNVIAQNRIGDLYYTGISIGWTWGYGPATAGGNVVEKNEIHHVGIRTDGDGPILSDMGGIYTLGTQEKTVIRDNFFHDVAAIRYGGWGIYFDEGSTHLEAVDNFVLNTTHGGFHQHYGKENLVHHNLFAYGRDAQIQRSRPEEHTSFTFDHNVVVANGGELFAGDLRDGHYDFHDNVYELKDAGAARFAGKSFADWQAAGRDARSIVAPVDLEHELDAGGHERNPQIWFAPRSSPIWMVLHADAMSGRHLRFVRDRS